jgi:hypothetical protein
MGRGTASPASRGRAWLMSRWETASSCWGASKGAIRQCFSPGGSALCPHLRTGASPSSGAYGAKPSAS